MKRSLQLVDYEWQGGPSQLRTTLMDIVRTAEQAGFDSIGVTDHLWASPWMGGPERAMLQCYPTLAFLAAVTERIRLLSCVTATPFRHPALLAKTVTTLDVLSGGRAWLGIGAAHDEAEARGLGVPFPPVAERFEMMEDTLQVCLRMWSGESGDNAPFVGHHYQLVRALNLPQALSKPHPPILIAGDGARKTLRLVARYANACSLRPGPDIPHKLNVLRSHCESEGTDYDAIERTCAFVFDVGQHSENTTKLIEQLHELSELGIDTVFGRIGNVDRITPIEVMGRDVIPTVARYQRDLGDTGT